MGSERTEKRRLGVVLSGGGARGFAHVGALRALNHIGIYPDFIVGVSMGAAVGATYALNDDWYDTLINMDISGFRPLPDFSTPGMMNYVKNLRVAQKAITGMYFGWGVGQPTADWGRAVLSDLTLNKPLEAGRIPIFATATDIVSGERVFWVRASDRRAVCERCLGRNPAPGRNRRPHSGGWRLLRSSPS